MKRDRANEPAELKRRIERLEALLVAERLRADRAWDAYRSELNEAVDAKLKLKRIERVLRGEE
jgi:hypothetical protein